MSVIAVDAGDVDRLLAAFRAGGVPLPPWCGVRLPMAGALVDGLRPAPGKAPPRPALLRLAANMPASPPERRGRLPRWRMRGAHRHDELGLAMFDVLPDRCGDTTAKVRRRAFRLPDPRRPDAPVPACAGIGDGDGGGGE